MNSKKIIYTVCIAIATISTLNLSAQDVPVDKKAKDILDKLSVKTKSYTSIKADFTITIANPAKKTSDTQSGTLEVKGDKYKLSIKGQDIISDGKVVWTYLKDANEVQINNVDNTSDDAINPTTIFTIYEKGFKYAFQSETKKGTQTIETIDLFPLNPAKKKYHTVKLMIDKAKNQITEFVVMMKDASTVTYTIKNFIPNVPVDDTTFTYNPKDHPGADVVDLRE
ncbi:MAG TPA: outer membrane lipoprotein carrier protein LolA [Bacteroidia bacterium]|nr:outer membrane lipoprotein carrier protein LolA [Bacteroidia bacterium]